MSEEPARLEAEWVEPEDYLGPRMKKITFQCPICSHVWSRTYKAEPKNDPACPNKHCSDKREIAELKQRLDNLQRMLESGEAPARIGANHRNKAIDVTANIVMQDNHLTDLKDSIRPGESMAPKLPVPMQAAADNFFGGQQAALGSGQNVTRLQKRMQMLGQRVLSASAPMPMSIAPNQVLPKTRPGSVQVVNDAYKGRR